MLIEIIKKGSYYTVPLFEEMGLKQERVVVEISNDVLQNLQAEKNGIRSTPEPAYSDEYLNEHWRELREHPEYNIPNPKIYSYNDFNFS